MAPKVRYKPLLIALFSLIILSLFPLVSAASSSVPVGDKLDSRIAGQAAELGNAKYIVFLKDKADLSGAASLSSKEQKGEFVVNALKAAAERSQKPILALLEKGKATGAVAAYNALWIDNVIAVEGDAATAEALARRPDVERVALDEVIQIDEPVVAAEQAQVNAVEWNIAKIRADQVWATWGVIGTGSVIGVIDTGADVTHPAIASKYRGNNAISWYDAVGAQAGPYDDNGHGTHTTGTSVGDDGGANKIGVAPGAKFIAAKAFNSGGSGGTSQILNAMQWMLAPGGSAANAPHIVNNSWGNNNCSYPDFRSAVQSWQAAGILPVFSNGNAGPGAGTVGSPAGYPESFGVGATDSNDVVANFSSRGPSCWDGSIKPNVSAPGVAIRSSVPGGAYQSWNGTSMAAPHVSGLAALIRQANPGAFTADATSAVKNIIASTTKDLGPAGPDNDYGTGRIDALAAVALAKGVPAPGPNIEVSPTSFNENVPPGGNVTKQLTIKNTGTAPLNWTGGTTVISGQAATGVPASEIVHGPRGASKGTPLQLPTVEALQTIITDPAGDDIVPPGTSARVDVVSVESEVWGGAQVGFRINYSGSTDMFQAIGFLLIDTLQTPGTGLPPTNWGGKASQDIGVQFVVDLWNAWFGSVDVYDKNNNYLQSFAASPGPGNSFQFTLPLSALGGDDGSMSVVVVSKHFCDGACLGSVPSLPWPTSDWAPDTGHGETTLPWVTINPAAGTVNPGASQIVNVKLDAAGMTSGTQAPHQGKIIISSNDADTPSLEVPVTMNVGALPPVDVTNSDCNPDVFNPPGAPLVCGFTLNREAFAVLLVLDNSFNLAWVSPFDPAASKYPAGNHSINWAGQLMSVASGPYIPIIYAADLDGNSDFGFDPLIYVKADNGVAPIISNMTVTPAAAPASEVAAGFNIGFDVDKYHTSLVGVLNSTGGWVNLLTHPEAYAGHEAFLWDGKDFAGAPVPPGTYYIIAAAQDLFGRGAGCYVGQGVSAPSCFSFSPSGPASLEVAVREQLAR